MPKLIREGRFGPPKTFKTGSVVGTYPRPMLVLELDSGGLDTIPQSLAKNAAMPNAIPLEVIASDIVYIKPADLPTWVAKPLAEQPKVLCVDFATTKPTEINLTYAPVADNTSFPAFINALNTILRPATVPWKTVVVDNTTRLSDIIYGHVAASNPGLLADARKWAPAIGNKIADVIAQMTKLEAHFVIIMHEATDKNEVTGEVKTEPSIYSAYRQIVGGSLSQFFYQTKIGGVPKIITTDNGYIKGLGPRWPLLPPNCGVTFMDIYGESVKNGEIEPPNK